MSIFAVNHLCREVLRDHAFRAAITGWMVGTCEVAKMPE